MDKQEQQAFITLLHKELVPAMGCTEPISIAYVAAKAREVLQEPVKAVTIYASGNIIKNVKSVTVPNTSGGKGIDTAVAIGIVAGKPELDLEVISQVTEKQIVEMKEFLQQVPITIHRADTFCALEITVQVFGEQQEASVCVRDEHANIVKITKNNISVLEKTVTNTSTKGNSKPALSMEAIYNFATTVDIVSVKEILDTQIQYNLAIASKGLEGGYGVEFGKTLLSVNGNCLLTKAKALAAAGSDARMGGCDLPVIINGGSGNQGMTVSLPVISYARELQASDEQLYRALLISNLTSLYQKQYVGRLSAYCGVVSAGAAAGAGITYLLGGDFDHICHTVVNALAITSGIICDGAKPSCAAKIAAAVDAGIMGYTMYQKGQQFCEGEGIVHKNVDDTIKWVGDTLAKRGMKSTDDAIIEMMVQTN